MFEQAFRDNALSPCCLYKPAVKIRSAMLIKGVDISLEERGVAQMSHQPAQRNDGGYRNIRSLVLSLRETVPKLVEKRFGKGLVFTIGQLVEECPMPETADPQKTQARK